MVTRRILALALALVALSALGAPSAGAQETLLLEGEIAEGTPRYFELPFAVPAGIVEIEVRHDDLSEANILDFGLRDPARFRGWGGGNEEPAVVGLAAASRSYVPGAMEAGEWAVLVGQAKISERPARYRIEIDLRAAPTLDAQPERRPYAPVAALASEERWYAGDFHVHSRESGDAHPTLDAVATFARSRGLDFVELSEHNTVSQLELVVDAQSRHPDLLLVPGIEITTYAGHANAIGATEWVEFRVGDAVTGQRIADEAAALGAPFALNHPVLDLGDRCIGCAWELDVAPGSIAAMELQNGAYSSTGALFYRLALALWESLLAEGGHVAPIGGSDDHRAGVDLGAFQSPIGSPTTMVYARELSVAAIVEAVAAGRTVLKLEGPEDPMVELRAGDSLIGDTVDARRVTLEARVTGGAGLRLAFVQNGVRASEVEVDADPFTVSHDVEAPGGDRDDRWRLELLQGSRPRVVTGHIWIRPTGDVPPIDAGSAGGGDGGGCDCRAAGAGADAAPPATLALALLLLGLARTRRDAQPGGLAARRRGGDIRRRGRSPGARRRER